MTSGLTEVIPLRLCAFAGKRLTHSRARNIMARIQNIQLVRMNFPLTHHRRGGFPKEFSR